MAGIDKVGRFAVNIDEAVEDMAARREPGSYHAGMNGLGHSMRGGAMGAA